MLLLINRHDYFVQSENYVSLHNVSQQFVHQARVNTEDICDTTRERERSIYVNVGRHNDFYVAIISSYVDTFFTPATVVHYYYSTTLVLRLLLLLRVHLR